MEKKIGNAQNITAGNHSQIEQIGTDELANYRSSIAC